MGSYEFRQSGYRVRVDTEPQVIAVELSDPPGLDLGSDLEPFDYDPEEPRKVEVPPSPTLLSAELRGECVPLMAFAHKAKLFDDWLYATLDQMAYSGDCPVVGKRGLVEQLRSRVGATGVVNHGRAILHAAGQLAGEEPDEGLPPKLRLGIRKLLKEFDASSLCSRPIGFYAESEELSRLFRHDRILQEELDDEGVDALRDGLRDAALIDAYSWHLRLASCLTGAFAKPSLLQDDTEDGRRCLFPPSRAPETDLVKRLYGNVPIPEGFELLDEVVGRVKDGRLSLKPSPKDGWYLRQLYALEALLLESDAGRLRVGERYAAELEKLFKGLMGLARETHVKQLECPLVGAGLPELTVSPRLRVEPFPHYYQRVAETYDWLGTALGGLWGTRGLEHDVRDRHGRLTCVADAIGEMSTLFAGASLLAAEDLGQAHDDDRLARLCRSRARGFCAAWQADPDIATDVRMMVPLYFDLSRKRTRVSVVCGFGSSAVEARFASRPDVRVRNRLGLPSRAHITWENSIYDTVHPVSFECDVREVLNRDDLRKMADEHRTPTSLKSALEAL